MSDTTFRLIHDEQHRTIAAVLRWLVERDHLKPEAAKELLRAVATEAQQHAAELERYCTTRRNSDDET